MKQLRSLLSFLEHESERLKSVLLPKSTVCLIRNRRSWSPARYGHLQH
jgi:hypothetical protein